MITVRVDNAYACGRESSREVTVRGVRSGESLAEWWDDVVWPETGDGHACGADEDAVYTAEIVDSPEEPVLVGEVWEG